MPVTGVSLRPTARILLLIGLISVVSIVFTAFWLQGKQSIQRATAIVYNAAQGTKTAESFSISGPSQLEATSEVARRPVPPPPEESSEYCKKFPDPGNIAVVLKTGATEIRDKVPAQLATSLRCVRDPLIFSDLEQDLGVHHVYDVLANFTADAKDSNPDFDLYRTQQEYLASGRESDLPSLRNTISTSQDWRTKGKSAAWELDKYKFLHMVELSWKLAPDRDWYVYVESDTYLSWANLLQWLATLDGTEKRYFGNAVRMHEYTNEVLYFGHGGSGILLSGALVRDFAVTHSGIAHKFDQRISKMWYGDFVLAAALFEELRIKITDAQGSLAGEDPTKVTFRADVWCRPALTIHHMIAQHTNTIWQHERGNQASLLRWRDVYRLFFSNGLPSKEVDWDNGAWDERFSLLKAPGKSDFGLQGPHASYEACEAACTQIEECLQFVFIHTWTKAPGRRGSEGRCHLSSAIRRGGVKPPEFGKDRASTSWTSGWMNARIDEWVEKHNDCESEAVTWPR